jgi:hypothetical protein
MSDIEKKMRGSSSKDGESEEKEDYVEEEEEEEEEEEGRDVATGGAGNCREERGDAEGADGPGDSEHHQKAALRPKEWLPVGFQPHENDILYVSALCFRRWWWVAHFRGKDVPRLGCQLDPREAENHWRRSLLISIRECVEISFVRFFSLPEGAAAVRFAANGLVTSGSVSSFLVTWTSTKWPSGGPKRARF